MNKKFEVKRDNNKYYIYDLKNKKRISDHFDYIYARGLIKFKSNCYIAKNNNIEYLYYYDESNNKNTLIEEADEFSAEGLVNNDSNYFIAKKDNYSYIYYYNKNNNQKKLIISHKGYIDREGLVKNQSKFYIVYVENNTNPKSYIYKYDEKLNKNILITNEEFDDIFSAGLVEGASSFYAVRKKDENDNYIYYLYRYDELNNKSILISDKFDEIDISSGLLKNESNFLRAGFTNRNIDKYNVTYYIYKYNREEDKLIPILNVGFHFIYTKGLIRGESNYFIAAREKKKYRLYKYLKDLNKVITISNKDFFEILPYGVITNENDHYYIVRDINDKYEYKIYDISNNLICKFRTKHELEKNLFNINNNYIMFDLNNNNSEIIELRKKCISDIIKNTYNYKQLINYFKDLILNKKMLINIIPGLEDIIKIEEIYKILIRNIGKNRKMNVKKIF